MRGPNTKKGQKAFRDTVAPESNDFSIEGGDYDENGRLFLQRKTSNAQRCCQG